MVVKGVVVFPDDHWKYLHCGKIFHSSGHTYCSKILMYIFHNIPTATYSSYWCMFKNMAWCVLNILWETLLSREKLFSTLCTNETEILLSNSFMWKISSHFQQGFIEKGNFINWIMEIFSFQCYLLGMSGELVYSSACISLTPKGNVNFQILSNSLLIGSSGECVTLENKILIS